MPPGGRPHILLSAETGKPYAAVLRRVTDYFELEQIRSLTQWLEGEEDLKLAGSLLAAGVAVMSTELSDAYVAMASIAMVDDLYKSMNAYATGAVASPLPVALATYLDSTANSLLRILRDRGYRLEYAVENSFPNGYGGPVYYYRDWFRAAGFLYVSPFPIALTLMEHDGHTWGQFEELWSRYRDEARIVATRLYERVCAEDDYAGWVVLDEDLAEPPLALTRNSAPRPGVVRLYRNALPVKGTGIEQTLPDGLREEVERVMGGPPGRGSGRSPSKNG